MAGSVGMGAGRGAARVCPRQGTSQPARRWPLRHDRADPPGGPGPPRGAAWSPDRPSRTCMCSRHWWPATSAPSCAAGLHSAAVCRASSGHSPGPQSILQCREPLFGPPSVMAATAATHSGLEPRGGGLRPTESLNLAAKDGSEHVCQINSVNHHLLSLRAGGPHRGLGPGLGLRIHPPLMFTQVNGEIYCVIVDHKCPRENSIFSLEGRRLQGLAEEARQDLPA